MAEAVVCDIYVRACRLGVGAAIPESSNMLGRDAARLKNKLAGKKHARDEEDAVANVPSEDEEESRAGAIKKKAKLDPFTLPSEGKGKKAKKSHLIATPSPAGVPVSPPERKTGNEQAHSSVAVDADEADDRDISPKKKRKKKKKHVKTTDESIVDLTSSPVPVLVLVKPTSRPEPGPSTLPIPPKTPTDAASKKVKHTG